MYLSCLLIDVGKNPDRPRPGRLWLRNLYHVHQRLCMAFPSAPKVADDGGFLKPFKPGDLEEQVHVARASDAGFLFRVDPQLGGRAVILVQSAVKPAWEYAFRNAGHFLAEPPKVKALDLSFRIAQRLRFHLRANPTERRVFGEPLPGQKPSGKRIGVHGEEMQRAWLDRKAAENGFRILSCVVTDRGFQTSRRSPGSPPIRHLCVDFDGILEVTEPELFLDAFQSGIGSAKGFGFGLLSVARA